MIRKLALLAGVGFIAKKLLDRSHPDAQPGPGSATAQPRAPETSPAASTGHVPADLMGDSHPDDGGTEHNAHLKVHLDAGKEYLLRLRLRYAKKPGQAAVMVW